MEANCVTIHSSSLIQALMRSSRKNEKQLKIKPAQDGAEGGSRMQSGTCSTFAAQLQPAFTL